MINKEITVKVSDTTIFNKGIAAGNKIKITQQNNLTK